MYKAIDFGWVSSKNLKFSATALDIQTLNDEALKGTFEATAISFALYPLICDEYALLRTAVSFGEGYGPKLVKKKGAVLKRNFKVALSGKYTPNALLFRMAYPQARIAYDDRTPERPRVHIPVAMREKGSGRPTKKERRELDRLRGYDSHEHY